MFISYYTVPPSKIISAVENRLQFSLGLFRLWENVESEMMWLKIGCCFQDKSCVWA